MPSGAAPGERRGGRKKGTPNKAGVKRLQKALKNGISPLEHLLEVLRDPLQPTATRLEAAKGAAPYVHPRLQTVEHLGKDGKDLVIKVVKFADE